MKQKNEMLDSMPKAATPVFAVIVMVCALFLLPSQPVIAGIIIITSVLILLEKAIWHFVRIRKMKEYISDAASDDDELQNNEALFKSMNPIAGIRLDGTVAWYNSAFKELFSVVSEKKVAELIPEINIRKIYEDGGRTPVIVKSGDNTYKVRANVKRKASADHAAIMLYMENITEVVSLKEELENTRCAVAHINVDNYDEVINSISDEERIDVISLLDKNIIGYMQDLGALVKKLEKDSYLCVFTKKQLDSIVGTKFEILSNVKSFDTGLKTPPTISIGIGIGGETLNKNNISAKKALEMALGRGGDQAVIRENGKFRYFGGNSKETEKRTKVKARIMARNLRELMENSDNVLIMGHRNSDADAIGAAIGIASMGNHIKKDAKVLLITKDDTVKMLMKKIEENHYLDEMFIGKSGLKEYITPKTLLVICDTHIPEYTEMPELIDSVKTKLVIDHHRRSESFIENADIVYHEPFSSSTCEMVAEIMQYFSNHFSVSTVVAEALYAGIAVDTKNFTFKTGVRTFEAAAYLRTAGVDTLHVKKLFRESIDNYKLKACIVTEAQLYGDNIAISLFSGVVPHVIIAEAADEMLEIDDIKASFVVARAEDGTVIVSGRSLGEVNVQVILEKLGGGGHMMTAGVQLLGTSVTDVGEMLKGAIDEINN